MPAEFGRLGHHDLVSEAGCDLVIATWAAVGLHCLVGLDVADLDRSGGYVSVVHESGTCSAEHGPEDQGGHDDQRGDHDDHVAGAFGLGAERVESHGVTVAARSSRPAEAA